jgi:16S rRNA (cytosine967-C5)-methyltransferase
MGVQRLAADAVSAVLAGRSLSATLEILITRYPQLNANERATIWDLVHGTLRQIGLLRAVMRQLLRKPIKEQGLEALLAVSLYQLEFTRTAAYAVVDQAVSVCASMGWPWAKAMVNAVLRRFQRERESILSAARTEDSGRYSYPQWWIQKVRSTYPRDWQQILEGGNCQPAMSLRVNVRRSSRAEYLERLSAEDLRAHACGEAGVLLERAMPVSRLPGFVDGCVSVQDASAQLAAQFLDLAPGQRVLDACAAPGGKTAHILERCDVQLLAIDIDTRRLARISENLTRLGLNAQVRCADARAPATWWDGQAFDRVLADVPCTASGVVRRHPDIKWLRRAADVPALAGQSSQLLDALWRVVMPGGKLLFVTCSIFREENRKQVDKFVSRHPDARIAALPVENGPDLQLLPDPSHDGFYYALLERC